MHEKLNLNIETDKPRDHCAVVGIMSFKGEDIAPHVRLALHAQQNRGEDGAGIAAYSDYSKTFQIHKDLGFVAEAFPDGKLEEQGIFGHVVIGHTRYATSGTREEGLNKRNDCLQPYVVSYNKNSLALAHNGNIPERYLEKLRRELPPNVPFQSDTDSEVIAWIILFAEGNSWREKVINGLNGVIGAYSFVIATDEGDLFGVKDPRGIRPLVLARAQDEAILVSESRGLEYMTGIEEKREIGNGQLAHIQRNGKIEVEQVFPPVGTARCLVESIYLKHPYSLEGGKEVRTIRERMGEELAREIKVPEDYVIIGIPDSGNEIADGYAQALGRKAENYIKKDRYRPGRSFISNSKDKRDKMLELKFTISNEIDGKNIVLIDDSIIRGNTTGRLIVRLKGMGAKEVHVLSASPKFIDICDLGVDIATLEELLALDVNDNDNYSVKSDQEIAIEIGAESVYYLSLEGLTNAVGGKTSEFCTNCLTRTHPIEELGESVDRIYTTTCLRIP